MKIRSEITRWAAALFLPAAMVLFGGCSSPQPLPPDTYAPPPAADPAAPIFLGSGASASAASGMVQVDAIDYTNRTVLLSRPDGEDQWFKVGPQYVNFDRVKVGDNLMTTTSKTFAAYLVKPGVSPGSITNSLVNTMPQGAQPGGVLIRNVDYQARVLAIDYQTRRVALQYGKDQAREVQVGPGVNLQMLHMNDHVFIHTTEAVAISVVPGS